MKKVWPWIVGILFALFTLAWLLVGRSDRDSYHAARGDSTGRLSLLQPTPIPGEPAASQPVAPEGCTTVSQSPPDGAVITPGTEFTATWELQNAGSDKWSEARSISAT